MLPKKALRKAENKPRDSGPGDPRQRTLEDAGFFRRVEAAAPSDNEATIAGLPAPDMGSEISGSDQDVDATVRPRRSEGVTRRRDYVESPFTTSAPSSGSDNDLDKLGHEEWFPLRDRSRGGPERENYEDHFIDSDESSGDRGEERRRKRARGQRQPTIPVECGDSREPSGDRGEERRRKRARSQRQPTIPVECGGGSQKARGCPKSRPDSPPQWFTPGERRWKPEEIKFSAMPGPIGDAAELESENPVDFFELLASDELLQLIVTQTNLYAEQCLQRLDPEHIPSSRMAAWKPVTLDELKTFLGLLFLTGIVVKHELAQYWSTDEVIETPYFGRTMARNRFQLILKFLHYTDNTEGVRNDRLYKIRPVFDYLVKRCEELYQPNVNISIDEGTLLWRGRLSFKVYNPAKPIKYGIKSYILCDSDTGYCHKMQPYIGEGVPLADTVVNLLGWLAGKGYHLIMDNFYNSVNMCYCLLDLKTHVCGTLRKNRGEPPAVGAASNSDLAIGERITLHNERVMTLAWRDTHIVKMVTTFHQDDMTDV